MKCGLPARQARLARLCRRATSCRRAARRESPRSDCSGHRCRRARCPGCCPAGCSGAAACAAQDAAQHVAEAARWRGLRLGPSAGRRRAPLRELLADVGQHDRRQDRQQFLDQITTAGARCPPAPRRRHRCCCHRRCARRTCRPASSTWSTLTPPSSKAAGALLGDGGLEVARVDVVSLDVLLRHRRPVRAPACE